jgi:CheY-like chemotaxis protein
MSPRTILIVEDGDEYLENLSRFVPGPRYLQAHGGAEALALLAREPVDLVYLDMRFDRVPRSALLGDHEAATREQNGDALRGWRHLEVNQGLFILDYDFSRERRRLKHLQTLHPNLRWVPDAVTPGEIRDLMDSLPRIATE